jgi:hypothetical protein
VSADPTSTAGEPGSASGEVPGQPSEEELRAAYEAELSRITTTDMMAQSVVSLLNIAARRLGLVGDQPEPEAAGAGAAGARDLEQVRDAIDAITALLEILERRMPQELRSLRDALSQVQMAYAREAQAAGGAPAPPSGPGGQTPPGGATDSPAPAEGEEGAGPAVSSGRLWVPGR